MYGAGMGKRFSECPTQKNALGRASPCKASANDDRTGMAGAQGISRVAPDERDPR